MIPLSTRAHLARISAERVGQVIPTFPHGCPPLGYTPPVAPAEAENRRRWGSVLLTLLTMLPVLRALAIYITKGEN